MTSLDPLFRPFRLKGLELPNRIVMAPMTRMRSPNQTPNEKVAAYYRTRAEGGVGLILSEGTSPEHPSSSYDVNIPAFYGEGPLQGWANVLAAVRSAGGHMIPQLWHPGIVRGAGTGPHPATPSASPSGIAEPQEVVGEPASLNTIDELIAGFAKSAGYAKDLGFDGVEIHGAHGYLLDQFFWESTNKRTDAYGGTIENRARFAAEIVRAVRVRVGPDFPILLRFSQFKQKDYVIKVSRNPAELERFLRPLIDAGVDMFHCSQRRFWEAEFPDTGSDLNLAGWTKKITGLPTISVGSVTLGEDQKVAFMQKGSDTSDEFLPRIAEMLDRGNFDLIAIGRALIVNPDWPKKIRAGHFDQLSPWTPKALGSLV